ncbi:epithelial cell-transforming sequence 2 oncogene-like isoform X7 [Canis lupus dingo]|uniref:epithelial cell-transforming sequence 2 oncogene-like isoform X7 n=1 Tax=Canis lupus dingo TaxID=286419 RepID=UPI0020C58852|nr:epithelial cell-transforming sequence 2 oncogene-like isoform X7 [Canis lupus dingo]
MLQITIKVCPRLFRKDASGQTGFLYSVTTLHFSIYLFLPESKRSVCSCTSQLALEVLTEQDCLWMSKCIRFGWFLPYTPADNEYGAWKHHYIACVSNLDWLTPREAAAIYGTLNEPKTKYEELQEKQREKCLRKLIWEKSALRKKELFKVRPPWVSGTCCSRLLKSKCQPRLSQALKDLRDRGGLHEALEKQLVLASLEALPKQNNLSGSHSYPLLSKKTWHGVHKNDDSSSHASQPHFLLISSRIPAYEIVVASIRTGIISVVYEHSSLTLDSLLYLIEKALDGQKVQSMGIFSDGDSREINLLQGYKIGIKNLLRPEVRDFWEKLGSYVAPEEEGGHVDLFVPLGASEAGIEVLSQLSQLTGTFFTAPMGIATGSYQHILSDWLGRPERAPCSIYFSESKLYTWSRVTDFLEDTLKSVRKQLSPLFKELQKNISARIIGKSSCCFCCRFITKVVPDLEWIIQGQFTFDNMNMANILDNQEISQALADGLMELSKDNSDKPLEFLSDFLLKKCGKGSQDLEENVIPTKCDPKAAFSLLPKERNVIEDSPQDTKSSLSKNDPNLEMLVKLGQAVSRPPERQAAGMGPSPLRGGNIPQVWKPVEHIDQFLQQLPGCSENYGEDEAKHQDERSAARHTENRAGMPGAYSDLLITSHARDFNLTSLAKGDMQILIQLTSIECLLHAMCQQAFTFHILDSASIRRKQIFD